MQEPLTREQVRARMDAIPDVLSDELIERMSDDRARGWENPYRTSDEDALRREERPADRSNIWRPAFVRDVEKILHMPAYNRYAGKTQVFSFRSNDDLYAAGSMCSSWRALHVISALRSV